jgi:hypothetical protein
MPPVDAVIGRTLLGPSQRLVDELDRRDLPAAPRQMDGVLAGAATHRPLLAVAYLQSDCLRSATVSASS